MIPPSLSRLGSLRERDLAAEGLVVAEGRLVAERLVARADFEPVALLGTPETIPLFETSTSGRWLSFTASEAELSAFAGYRFHRGVIAIARRPAETAARDLAASLSAHAYPPLLVLPQTRDPENLGALARSAAVFGFGALLLGAPCPDFLSRRTLRVSMGAVLGLPFARVKSPEDWKTFAEGGYSLSGAVIDPSARDVATWEVPRPCAIALGDEYAGLDGEWLAACDEKVTIAMALGPDSLNVAAAGSILMWRVATASGAP